MLEIPIAKLLLKLIPRVESILAVLYRLFDVNQTSRSNYVDRVQRVAVPPHGCSAISQGSLGQLAARWEDAPGVGILSGGFGWARPNQNRLRLYL